MLACLALKRLTGKYAYAVAKSALLNELAGNVPRSTSSSAGGTSHDSTNQALRTRENQLRHQAPQNELRGLLSRLAKQQGALSYKDLKSLGTYRAAFKNITKADQSLATQLRSDIVTQKRNGGVHALRFATATATTWFIREVLALVNQKRQGQQGVENNNLHDYFLETFKLWLVADFLAYKEKMFYQGKGTTKSAEQWKTRLFGQPPERWPAEKKREELSHALENTDQWLQSLTEPRQQQADAESTSGEKPKLVEIFEKEVAEILTKGGLP
ncbi:unnamed protein product [Amoebophrya sp. A120]|nr:unnamed protein product [Amoebophrya sp. A120]|eukprot:GSA120T00006997001.1